MKNKIFDCVKIKHDIQKKILKEMKGLTLEQQRKKVQKDIESDSFFGPVVRNVLKVRKTENL